MPLSRKQVTLILYFEEEQTALRQMNKWLTLPFTSQILFLVSPFLSPLLLESPPSQNVKLVFNVLGWIYTLTTFLTFFFIVLGYMLEHSWTKSRFSNHRTRSRSRRFKTQPGIDICCPGLFLLVHVVGFCAMLYIALLCCNERESTLILLPWQQGGHHLMMLMFKRLERNEIVELESGGGGIEEEEEGLVKGS